MLHHLDMVKCATKVKRFAKGSVIMQAGDISTEHMYILIKGNVAACADLHQPTEKLVATYKAGDFFGEDTLFLGHPPAVTMIAIEDVISLPLNRRLAEEFFVEQPAATFFLLEELCKRAQYSIAVQATPQGEHTTTAQAAPAHNNPASPQTTAKPAAKPGPEPAASTTTVPGKLFPEGHKAYQLKISSPDSDYLFMKSHVCPICGHNFKFLTVKGSKLIAEHTDTDLRVHYTGVEPLHYDVITCPNCWYSAMTDMFKDGICKKEQLSQVMEEYKGQLQMKLDESRDSIAIFAGYYLALICAGKCFRNSDAAVGKLWMKISRLYDDCEDEAMSLFAAEQALKSYMSAYERSNTTGRQNQQLFYIIGELSLRMNDLTTARKFLFQAKTDKGGSPVITRHAEDRIEYLRQLSMEQED